MKIFMVYPNFSWASGDIASACERSLRELGHEVEIFNPYTEGFFQKKILIDSKIEKNLPFKINPVFLKEIVYERMFFKVMKFKPDIAFFIHGGDVPSKIPLNFKNYNIKTVLWLVDDPHEIDYSSTYSSYYDYVFTNEINAVDVHIITNKNSFYLPVGYDEKIFYNYKINDKKYISDVCFIGSAFKDRVKLFEELYPYIKNLNIKIIGNWLNNLSEDSRLKKFVVKDFVKPEEAAKYYNGAKIVLNPHRNPYGQSLASNLWDVKGSSPNPRLFEITATNAFCITDKYREECFKFFKEGEEIDSFKDAKDLSSKIDYWLKEDEKRKEAVRMANEKNMKNNIKNRMINILDVILSCKV